MSFKGRLKIPLVNSPVTLIPVKFEIPRLGRVAPIRRDLLRGPPHSDTFFLNNSVIQ